jgi:hypothetical protein
MGAMRSSQKTKKYCLKLIFYGFSLCPLFMTQVFWNFTQREREGERKDKNGENIMCGGEQMNETRETEAEQSRIAYIYICNEDPRDIYI